MPRQRLSSRSSLSGAPTPSLMAAGDAVVLSVYQGDDKRWKFHLTMTGGGPFDLTGYTAALQFRTGVADSAPSGAVTPLVEVTDAANGDITVTLSSEQSRTMTQPSYIWDLEITHTASSWTTTIAVGTLAVTKEVTRTVGT